MWTGFCHWACGWRVSTYTCTSSCARLANEGLVHDSGPHETLADGMEEGAGGVDKEGGSP